MRRFAVCAVVLAACGSGSNSAKKSDAAVADGKHVDAKPVDAKPADAPPDAPHHVLAVSCTGITPDATVTTAGDSYSPTATTITTNQIVEFQMPSAHNVVSIGTNIDSGLSVGFGQTGCLQFTVAGTYEFECSVHLFTGTVTVN